MIDFKRLIGMAKQMKQRKRLDILATINPKALENFKQLLKITGYHVEDDAEQPHGKKV